MSILEDRLAWLDQVKEDVLEPERPIVDPHHHLWPGELHYLLDDLWKDTDDGHNIKKTVFIECSQEYLLDGDESSRPVGETIFVRNISLEAKKQPDKARSGGDSCLTSLGRSIVSGRCQLPSVRVVSTNSTSGTYCSCTMSRLEPRPGGQCHAIGATDWRRSGCTTRDRAPGSGRTARGHTCAAAEELHPDERD